MLCHTVRDHEEAIKNLEGEGWNSLKIHRRNCFTVITQKSLPPFCTLRISRRFPHPAENSSFGDFEAQHIELAVKPRRTLGRILCNHTKDESQHLLSCGLLSSTNTLSRKPLPVQPETGSMPVYDRFRLDHYQRSFPSGPEPSQEHPEKLVRRSEPWFGLPCSQNSKLLM